MHPEPRSGERAAGPASSDVARRPRRAISACLVLDHDARARRRGPRGTAGGAQARTKAPKPNAAARQVLEARPRATAASDRPERERDERRAAEAGRKPLARPARRGRRRPGARSRRSRAGRAQSRRSPSAASRPARGSRTISAAGQREHREPRRLVRVEVAAVARPSPIGSRQSSPTGAPWTSARVRHIREMSWTPAGETDDERRDGDEREQQQLVPRPPPREAGPAPRRRVTRRL